MVNKIRTPKELIEEAQKSKDSFEEDGLYSHQIGEDVSGAIIIAEIDAVIDAYELMRESCLKIIIKEPDEDEESIILFKKILKQKIKNGKISNKK